MTKAQSELLGILLLPLILVGGVCAIFIAVFDSFGVIIPVILTVGIIVAFLILRGAIGKARRNALLVKYGDQEIVDSIMSKSVWAGQTCDQLIDSIGRPADIDEKVLKTKRKAIWKYAHKGGKRYGLRVTVENDIVVGWDEKL